MSADQDALGSDALRAFAVFAEHRNFTTAAAQLRLSQPSLHVKIRKLGAALGVDLYQREGRQLALTTAGEQLAAFAQDAQRRVAEFLTELHDNPAPLRLAAGRGALRWVISSAVQALIRSARPLQLVPANREAALGALSAGTADLAVIAFDPPPRGLRSRQIAEYPQVLAIGTRHPLASRAELRRPDLAGLDLLVPPAGRPHRRTIERALGEAGVPWRVAAEVDGWDLTVHFAALGLGAAVINGCVGLPSRLRAVPIVDLPRLRYWAVWRPQRERALADVLELL